jgi:hypothetical protein
LGIPGFDRSVRPPFFSSLIIIYPPGQWRVWQEYIIIIIIIIIIVNNTATVYKEKTNALIYELQKIKKKQMENKNTRRQHKKVWD